MALPDNHVRLG